MATYTSNTINGYYLTVDVTESDVSTDNNTSVVNYTYKLHRGSSRFVDYAIPRSLSIDGTQVYSSSSYIGFSSSETVITLTSGSRTITHSDDGSKTVAISFSATGLGDYSWSGTLSGSGSFALTTIDRGVMRLKVNGEWKKGLAYIKVNNEWKKAKAVYIKVNGEWKRSK